MFDGLEECFLDFDFLELDLEFFGVVDLGFEINERFYELLFEDYFLIVLLFLGEIVLFLGCLCEGFEGGFWYWIMG